jgi:hypothetical protein
MLVGVWSNNSQNIGTIKTGVVLALEGQTYFKFSNHDTNQATYRPNVPQAANVAFFSSQAMYTDGEWIIPIAEWAGA